MILGNWLAGIKLRLHWASFYRRRVRMRRPRRGIAAGFPVLCFAPTAEVLETRQLLSGSLLPTITALSVTSGTTAGGTTVQITGTNLAVPGVAVIGANVH